MKILPNVLCQWQTDFGGGIVMVWDPIFRSSMEVMSKQIDVNMRFYDWQQSLISTRRNQEVICHPYTGGFIKELLQNVDVRSINFNLSLIGHLQDQLGCAILVRVTNTITLANITQRIVEEWDAIPISVWPIWWRVWGGCDGIKFVCAMLSPCLLNLYIRKLLRCLVSSKTTSNKS